MSTSSQFWGFELDTRQNIVPKPTSHIKNNFRSYIINTSVITNIDLHSKVSQNGSNPVLLSHLVLSATHLHQSSGSISHRISAFIWKRPATQDPSCLRVYPVRAQLQNRIFIPPYHYEKPGLLPLYLDIHGGGFAICTPEFDNEFCSAFAARNNILVVSLDYSKSPGHIFPTAVHDIVALTRAVIADESLPIDTSRIAIGGFSARGCLAMAAAKASDLRGKIQAVLGWYPVLDLSATMTQKLARRSYAYEGQKDSLEGSLGGMEWGYLRDL